MENKEKFIEELNKFLKGINMGMETFNDYIEKTQDMHLKDELVVAYQLFEKQKERVIYFIEKRDGEAKDTLGIIGEMSSWMEKIKDSFIDTDEEILKLSIKGIEMGIKGGNSMVQACRKMDIETPVLDELEKMIEDYKAINQHLIAMQKG